MYDLLAEIGEANWKRWKTTEKFIESENYSRQCIAATKLYNIKPKDHKAITMNLFMVVIFDLNLEYLINSAFLCTCVLVQLKFQYPIDLKTSFFWIVLENRLQLLRGTAVRLPFFQRVLHSRINILKKVQIIEMFERARWDDIIHSRIITTICICSNIGAWFLTWHAVFCTFRLLKTTISNNNKWMDTNVRVCVELVELVLILETNQCPNDNVENDDDEMQTCSKCTYSFSLPKRRQRQHKTYVNCATSRAESRESRDEFQSSILHIYAYGMQEVVVVVVVSTGDWL